MERNLAVKISEDLYFNVKVKAALEKKTLKQFVIELLENEVTNEKAPVEPTK